MEKLFNWIKMILALGAVAFTIVLYVIRSEIKPVEVKVSNIESEITEIKEDLREIKTDIKGLLKNTAKKSSDKEPVVFMEEDK